MSCPADGAHREFGRFRAAHQIIICALMGCMSLAFISSVLMWTWSLNRSESTFSLQCSSCRQLDALWSLNSVKIQQNDGRLKWADHSQLPVEAVSFLWSCSLREAKHFIHIASTAELPFMNRMYGISFKIFFWNVASYSPISTQCSYLRIEKSRSAMKCRTGELSLFILLLR